MMLSKTRSRSSVKKGPARDAKHLAKVRESFCICCDQFNFGNQQFPTEAHHSRAISPKTMGARVSDYLAVPLCRACHALLHMRGDERAWWKDHNIDPIAWIAQFSKEGAAEVARLRKP